MKTDLPDRPNYGERIAAVESDVRGITKEIHTLSENIREALERSSDELRTLSNQLSSIGKANWPVYISSAVLIMSIGAAALGPIIFRLGAIEEQMRHSQEDQVQHALLPVHPVAAKDLEAIKFRLEKLEAGHKP